MVSLEKFIHNKLVCSILGNSLNEKKYGTPTLETVQSISKELVGRNRQGLRKQQVGKTEVKEVLNRTANFDDEGLFEFLTIIPLLAGLRCE